LTASVSDGPTTADQALDRIVGEGRGVGEWSGMYLGPGTSVRVANLAALALLEICHAVANAEPDRHVDEGGKNGCLHQED
jgi:hypothetical protein